MFSDRTDWNLQLNRITRKLHLLRENGEKILDLTLSNPSRCELPLPLDLIQPVLNKGIPPYEPNPKGSWNARNAISQYYRKTGSDIDPESLFLTTSTSEAYGRLFQLLCNPGDEVLVPRPGYPLFDTLAGLHDVQLIYYDLTYDGEWRIDRHALEPLFGSRPRALVLLHPSNPAGSFITRDERLAVCSLARDHGCALIVDEVFRSFPLEGGKVPPSFAGEPEVPVFTLDGFSKLAGIPQLKVAWIVVSGLNDWRGEAIKRLEMIGDAYLSPTGLSQEAVPEVLRHIDRFVGPLRERISDNYDFLRHASWNSCSVLHTEGGWNAMLRVPSTHTDEEWGLRLLEEERILTHPGSLFGIGSGSFLVLSLLPPPETFQHAVTRMTQFFG